MAMDSVRMTEEQEEALLMLEEKFPELLPREDIITVLQEARLHANGINLFYFVTLPCCFVRTRLCVFPVLEKVMSSQFFISCILCIVYLIHEKCILSVKYCISTINI